MHKTHNETKAKLSSTEPFSTKPFPDSFSLQYAKKIMTCFDMFEWPEWKQEQSNAITLPSGSHLMSSSVTGPASAAEGGLHPVIAQVNGPLASFLIHFVRCYHSLEPARAAGNWMTIFSMLDRQEPFRQGTILDKGVLGHLRCLIIKMVKTVTIFPGRSPGTLGPVVVLSFQCQMRTGGLTSYNMFACARVRRLCRGRWGAAYAGEDPRPPDKFVVVDLIWSNESVLCFYNEMVSGFYLKKKKKLFGLFGLKASGHWVCYL